MFELVELDEAALVAEFGGLPLPCDVPGSSWPEWGEVSPGPATAERLARVPVAAGRV